MYTLPLFPLPVSPLPLSIPSLTSLPPLSPNHTHLTIQFTQGGQLEGEVGGETHKSWANYFIHFLSSYKEKGIDIWGITLQNEPLGTVWWNSMYWTGEGMRDWLKTDVGPLLRSSFPNVKIMILDDQRTNMNTFIDVILADRDASQYVDGVAMHWYGSINDNVNAFPQVGIATSKYPDLFFLATEACNGFLPWERGPKLGDWDRGVLYSYDIIGDINNGAVGWTDWNLVLDLQGLVSFSLSLSLFVSFPSLSLSVSLPSLSLSLSLSLSNTHTLCSLILLHTHTLSLSLSLSLSILSSPFKQEDPTTYRTSLMHRLSPTPPMETCSISSPCTITSATSPSLYPEVLFVFKRQ